MKVIRNVRVEMDLTPEVIAEAIWDMSAVEQVMMFNHLCDISNKKPNESLEVQMDTVGRYRDPCLTEKTRNMIVMIGNMVKKEA